MINPEPTKYVPPNCRYSRLDPIFVDCDIHSVVFVCVLLYCLVLSGLIGSSVVNVNVKAFMYHQLVRSTMNTNNPSLCLNKTHTQQEKT